jgi:hypothetical protein
MRNAPNINAKTEGNQTSSDDPIAGRDVASPPSGAIALFVDLGDQLAKIRVVDLVC